jgi:hypothetical protein
VSFDPNRYALVQVEQVCSLAWPWADELV